MPGFHLNSGHGTALCLARDFRDFDDWRQANGLCFLKHKMPMLILHPSQVDFSKWNYSLPKRCYVTSKAQEFWAFEECKHALNARKIPIFYTVPEEDK